MTLKLGTYKHYKGKSYEVVDTVRHSETLEELVLYKALYKCEDFPDGQLWVRPKKMFMGMEIREGEEVKRFSFVK